MTHNKLTTRDIAHLRESWFAAREDDSLPDGPEVVMTSIGYVNIWSDGEVSAHGQVLGVFDFDGDWSDSSDGEE